MRAQRGLAADFDVPAYLLTAVVNLLRQMSWQLSGDSSAPKPDLYYPPGSEPVADESETVKGDSMSMAEMDERLARYYTREG